MIIREFESLHYESYEKKRPKHEPTGSYVYLSRQLVKFMMIYDALNSHGYPVRTEMTATKQIPASRVCSMDQSELIEFPVDENLSKICSTDEDESKGIIFKECSTKDDESECVHRYINKQKDANNETEYE